jgi:CHASE3 domain sensor protein
MATGDPQLAQEAQTLRTLVDDKFGELEQTITLRRAGDSAGAMSVVRTERGKNIMDRIRGRIAAIHDEALTAAARARSGVPTQTPPRS